MQRINPLGRSLLDRSCTSDSYSTTPIISNSSIFWIHDSNCFFKGVRVRGCGDSGMGGCEVRDFERSGEVVTRRRKRVVEPLKTQLPSDSHFVKVASFASLSDLFTRLGEFNNAKKDGTAHATKVVQALLKLLEKNASDVVWVS